MADEAETDALQEDLDDLELDELNTEELNKFREQNAETIKLLEADIKLLERKIIQFGPGALPNKDFQVAYRPDGTSNAEEVKSRLQKEINDYTSRLEETAHLTGVTIVKINRQVLELDDNHCKKQFSLELLVLRRKVHLTFTLNENVNVNERSDLGGKVTWFEVKFEEDISKAVGADISKAADGLAIHSVLSLLKSYLQWQIDRDQIVKKYTDRYPENVTQLENPEGNKCLKIINLKPDHPEFILEWGRKTVDTRVEPDVKVSVNAPSGLLEMDSKNILRTIPEMFASMATTLGLDKAVECLIQLVTTDGQDVSPDQQELVEEVHQKQA